MAEPDSHLTDLVAGYQRFREERWPELSKLFEDLSAGQHPHIMLIACSDSRLDPHLMFDQKPGSMFLVRNVANLVPPYSVEQGHHGTSAAIEFAVKGLGVSDIIVMGHSHCGGCKALMETHRGKSSGFDFVDSWMGIALTEAEVFQDSEGNPLDLHAVERQLVRLSLRNLLTFPWVKERRDAGTLRLTGLYFDVRTGTLERYNRPKARYEPFEAELGDT